ncbi:integrase catalytic domain-containing protein [Trichonephila clavipes]|nr:integrase catalytic domain-containing protein [Trichonephila clavipes]
MPPRAPNFGGLWEAGVKSFKFYLKRAVGNLKLTLEEFLTIITQIEGILNSRPITPLSEDIDDLEVLTPGHFLIGRPITSISEPNLLDKTENTLSRWQKLTKIVQHIWTKWSRDYLNNLQQRNKWQFHKDNVKLNAMVLIKDDNLPEINGA